MTRSDAKEPGWKLCYVAGPYRAPNEYGVLKNIERARDIAIKWWQKPYTAVICPHTNSAYFDGACPQETWLEGYLHILSTCDIVVMVPGWEQSAGSVAEHDLAMRLGKEIVYEE
jgi:hypothetical protein